ncbi:MAG: DUF4175 family protein [Deltaproteobacteria bacterium]|nr:DUF4175 family protein [Deltaproteobacteria bacterium]
MPSAPQGPSASGPLPGASAYAELQRFLRRIIHRLWIVRALEAGLLVLFVALTVVLAGPAASAAATLLPYAPFIYAILGWAALVTLLGLALWRLGRRLPPESVALSIEARHPRLGNNLINSLQLYHELRRGPEGPSPALIQALLRQTSEQVRSLKPAELVELKGVRTKLWATVPLAFALAGMLVLNPASLASSAGLLLNPWKGLPADRLALSLEPRGAVLPKGRPFTVQAVAHGPAPARVTLRLITLTGAVRSAPMERVGEGRFTFTLPSALASLRYQAAAGAVTSPLYSLEVVELPDVARLRVTYLPPEYSRLKPSTQEGGHLEALMGTAATLEITPTRSVPVAELELDDGRRLPLSPKGDRLQATMLLLKSGSYRIRLRDSRGFENEDPARYTIKVRPDEAPTVEILSPGEDLEVLGHEVLPLEYRARDDYGLRAVRLVYTDVQGKDRSLPLEEELRGAPGVRGRFNWDLSSLGLVPGERITYRVEALDTDTLSGPKVGISRSFTIALKDTRAEAKKSEELIRDLSEKLLNLLGDHLERAEGPPRTEWPDTLRQRMDELLAQMDRTRERLEQDRLRDQAMLTDLEALRRNLEFARDRLLPERRAQPDLQARPDQRSRPDADLRPDPAMRPDRSPQTQDPGRTQEQLTSELERMSLLADEMAQRARMQNLMEAGRELASRQQRLQDALDALRERKNQENLQAALRELDKLQQLIQQLMQALSQLSSQLPEEFLNSEALQSLNLQDMLQGLDQLRDALQRGDLERALQAARDLMQSLQQMLASLGMAGRQAMQGAMGRMQGEMQRQQSELQRILEEQQRILRGTEALERSQAERARRERPQGERPPEGATPGQPEPRGGRDATGPALGAPPGAQAGGRGAEASTGQEGAPRAPRTLTESERRRMAELAAREQAVRERTRQLAERLQALAQLLPFMDPEIARDLEEATSFMGQAQGELSREDSAGALPPEREALQRLQRSQQAMQALQQQMAMRSQLRGGPLVYRRGQGIPFGMRFPMPSRPEPSWMPEEGIMGLQREEFRLPGKQEHRVPPLYREEIMEALKQGSPPEYKEQIEWYFRRLTE